MAEAQNKELNLKEACMILQIEENGPQKPWLLRWLAVECWTVWAPNSAGLLSAPPVPITNKRKVLEGLQDGLRSSCYGEHSFIRLILSMLYSFPRESTPHSGQKGLRQMSQFCPAHKDLDDLDYLLILTTFLCQLKSFKAQLEHGFCQTSDDTTNKGILAYHQKS